MKRAFNRTLIALALAAATLPAFAADPNPVYDGRDLYNTNATLADLLSEATRLNTYNHGNTIALQIHDGQIVGLQQDQVRQDAEFKADQARQDAAQRATDNRVTNNTKRIDNHETRITSNTTNIGRLNARADDSDLAMIRETQRNDGQDARLAGHDQRFAQQDAVNEALSTKIGGLYTDMSGLRGEVRQARREAKQARAAASAALAVAGHQFDIHGGFQTAVSASTMGGYQALAIGAGGAISDRVFINGAVTTSSNQTGAVLSGTYSW